MFWVISIYFSIRNTLTKSGTFLLGHHVYRVSQEECARLRESVPYVKVYRYNPKHLYPKLNGYGDNGQRILKLLQLLLIDYKIHIETGRNMLIAVRNIKVTCEWHETIKLNYKNTGTCVIDALRIPSTLRRPQLMLSCDVRATVRGLQCTEVFMVTLRYN